MNNSDDFEIFLVGLPGFESVLGQEARERGFAKVETVAGGATCRGGWPEVWRANLEMRGASRVLVRIGLFGWVRKSFGSRSTSVPVSGWKHPNTTSK